MRGAQGKRCDLVGVRRRSQVFAFLSAPADKKANILWQPTSLTSPTQPSVCFSCYCSVPWCHSAGFNNIKGDVADHLAKTVLEHAIMTDFCGIPLVSLRENSITELNLERMGVGEPGAIVLSKLLPSAAALTSLKCACRPASVRLSVSAR